MAKDWQGIYAITEHSLSWTWHGTTATTESQVIFDPRSKVTFQSRGQQVIKKAI
jgi:hypothetical protein